jgi:hypothetical protein
VDSAFRRVPIAPAHRRLAWVVYILKGKVRAARHNAMPFGAIGAVHGWERVGALLKHLARRVLMLPVMRFVDDFFAPDRAGSAEVAMQCFARLLRALMGPSAIAPRKLECGNPLVVLGLLVELTANTVSVRVADDKAQKWTEQLQTALANGRMPSGDASKFAGRLNFAAQHTFRRLGRAMVRPFLLATVCPLPAGRMGPCYS